MRLRVAGWLLGLTWLLCSVPASAQLHLQLVEGGGNAAPYGQMLIYVDTPTPNFQVAAIPPAAYTGDNCAERRNSGFGTVDRVVEIDPLPGTLLRAFVSREFSYAERCPCGPGTCSVYPFCSVKFVGWTGACSGLGSPVSGGYECTFVYSGNDTIGSRWMFSGGAELGQTSCVSASASTSTTLVGASTTTTTLPPGSGPPQPVADDYWNDLKMQLESNPFTTPIAKFLFAPIPYPAEIVALLTAQAGSLQRDLDVLPMTIEPSAGTSSIVVAKGKARSRKGHQVKVVLRLTRRGRLLLKNQHALTVTLTVRVKSHHGVGKHSGTVAITG